jgi:hypothetical protein
MLREKSALSSEPHCRYAGAQDARGQKLTAVPTDRGHPANPGAGGNIASRHYAEPQEDKMAKGQLRSNREKKKPKADKNKKKNAAPISPFAARGQVGKKTP